MRTTASADPGSLAAPPLKDARRRFTTPAGAPIRWQQPASLGPSRSRLWVGGTWANGFATALIVIMLAGTAFFALRNDPGGGAGPTHIPAAMQGSPATEALTCTIDPADPATLAGLTGEPSHPTLFDTPQDTR